MNLITFTYTKKDGSVSERTLLANVVPGDKYAGIDLSDLEANKAQEFVNKASEIYHKYLEDTVALQKEYDLRHNYRQFFVSGMTDIVEV